MDYILRENLTIELVHNIMRDVHNRYMVDLIQEIQHNVVWIRTADGDFSFLIGKTSNNPYYVLRDNVIANRKTPKRKVRDIMYYNYLTRN